MNTRKKGMEITQKYINILQIHTLKVLLAFGYIFLCHIECGQSGQQ